MQNRHPKTTRLPKKNNNTLLTHPTINDMVNQSTGSVAGCSRHPDRLPKAPKQSRIGPVPVFPLRDPLGYVDGMSLYRGYFVPGGMDPTGTVDITINHNSIPNGAEAMGSFIDAMIDYNAPKNLSDQEVCWCKDNPICCFDSSNSRDRIIAAMRKRYGTPVGNASVFNAIQHCAWMCEVSNNASCSKSQAVSLGEAHEAGNPRSPQNDGMDLWNNRIGAGISSWTTDGCITECEQKAREYKLHWYEPIDTPAYPNKPTIPKPSNGLPHDYPAFWVDGDGESSGPWSVGGSSSEPWTTE